MWDMTHSYVRHDLLIHMWDMTHLWELHEAFTMAARRTSRTSSKYAYVWQDSFIRTANMHTYTNVERRSTCDMTHFHVWHESFPDVTRLVPSCVMTNSYVWHDAWRINTCDVTRSHVWRDSFIRVTWLIHTCDMTNSYAQPTFNGLEFV